MMRGLIFAGVLMLVACGPAHPQSAKATQTPVEPIGRFMVEMDGSPTQNDVVLAYRVIQQRLAASGVQGLQLDTVAEAVSGQKRFQVQGRGLNLQEMKQLFDLVTPRGVFAIARVDEGSQGDALKPGQRRLAGREPGASSLVVDPPFLTNRDIAHASSTIDPNRWPVIAFDLTPEGGKRFAEATTQLVGQRIAVIVDDVVWTAPVIREPITGGKGQIAGAASAEEAMRLANILNAGPLPSHLSVIEMHAAP